MNMRILVAALLIIAGTLPAAAAEPPTQFECRWADTPITIDGKADEAAWKKAQAINHFYLPWLQANARKARTATRARLLWDRENLYFFADMDDSDLYADVKEHDGQLWDNDVFELFFKPADNQPGYYEFQVNAAGATLDMFLPSRGAGGYRRFKGDAEFHVKAQVALRGTLNKWQDRDGGWSVEGSIPWKDSLRTGGRPEPGASWKFALCRYDYSVDFDNVELSTCAPLKSLKHANFHWHEDYASLHFIAPPVQGGAGKRLPLTTSRVVGRPEPPPPFRVQRAYPKLAISSPIAVVHEPGSDRLIAIGQEGSSKTSTLFRFPDRPDVDRLDVLLRVEDLAYDLTFHPDFQRNGFVYVASNGPRSAPGEERRCRVTRYTMSRKAPFDIDPGSAVVIIDWLSNGHDGAALGFGKDGYLYITSGDGTSDSDTNLTGQGLDHLLSKVLRIDVDHPADGKPYSVPRDNPFVGMKDVRPETWAYGFRNPWRLTVDAVTGHVWVGNNGQDLWEQIYLVRKGENYGWSVMEGSHPFYPNRKAGPTPFSKPTIEHPHSEARSLTGGIVYYGKKYPELRGVYIYGDYSTGKIWGARHDGTRITWHRELADTTLQITAFGTDSQGEILIADHRGGSQGALYTLEPTPAEQPTAPFPRTLSASGLFRSVKGHAMEPALFPYSVNAPLWSDGAYKERWLALPDDARLNFTTKGNWQLPDQTVFVKSFALEMEEGNPASRRWIETRFLTRQDGEWAGYSYTWNDEQTEGTLVSKDGLDRDYVIRTAGGTRVQKWHYPSRAECMVCHSRAAQYVLGFNLMQLNRDHDHGPYHGNQLATLEQLGIFRTSWIDEVRAALREEARAKGLDEKQINNHVREQTSTRVPAKFGPSILLPKPPQQYERFADPYDPGEDLTRRARSYLHANCAQCHVMAGGGNAQIDLAFGTSLEKMNLIDVKPLHHTFGLPDPRLVAPGAPERSVLLHRVGHRDAGYMPPLATAIVDDKAVEMLRAWIRSLKMEAPR